MEIVNGTQLANEIKDALRIQNEARNIHPVLAVLLVGEDSDSQVYVRLKEKAATAISGSCRVVQLPADTADRELLAQIEILNHDPDVHGIILQLPLPAGLAGMQDVFLAAIHPEKDVDGFNPVNRGLLMGGVPQYVSCAALACMDVIKRCVHDLHQRKAVLLGDSFDLILPLAVMLAREGCQTSIVPEYIAADKIQADIIVAEKGCPGMLAPDQMPGCRLVIDAGFYWEDNRVQGNVDPQQVAALTGYLVPVPGGMGPLLIAKLMENVSRAAQG